MFRYDYEAEPGSVQGNGFVTVEATVECIQASTASWPFRHRGWHIPRREFCPLCFNAARLAKRRDRIRRRGQTPRRPPPPPHVTRRLIELRRSREEADRLERQARKARAEAIVASIDAGLPIKDVCWELGISAGTVYSIYAAETKARREDSASSILANCA